MQQIQVSWMNISLVGGLEHEFAFPIILGRIIPTDELIFFRGVETTNQSFIRSSRSHGWFETWCSCWIWYSDISQGAFQSNWSHPLRGCCFKDLRWQQPAKPLAYGGPSHWLPLTLTFQNWKGCVTGKPYRYPKFLGKTKHGYPSQMFPGWEITPPTGPKPEAMVKEQMDGKERDWAAEQAEPKMA